MKKNFLNICVISLGIVSLFSCLKEDMDVQPSAEGQPFTIVANIATTKTENTGLKTSWTAGDAMNVFSIPDGRSDDEALWTNHGQFTLTDVTAGTFDGTLNGELTEGQKYYWHVIYPYNAAFVDPSGLEDPSDEQAVTVGHPSDGYAVQVGNDNMNHLSGQYFPLYSAASTTGNAAPEFTMHQLAAVVAVNVTNKTDAALPVSKVKFSHSSEYLVGTFGVDFGWVPGGHGSDYLFRRAISASNEAKLMVKDAVIPANGTAVYYLPIMPNKYAAGSTFTVTVNEFSKTLTLADETEIQSGYIKNVVLDVVETAGAGATFEAGTEDFLQQIIDGQLYGWDTPSSLKYFTTSAYPGINFAQNASGEYYITEINAHNTANFLKALPARFNLENIKVIYVNFDPAELCTFTDKTFPTEWNCPKLQRVHLERTGLTGVIPESFAALPDLRCVMFRACDLYGALPHNWAGPLESVTFGYDGKTDCPGLGYIVPASLDVCLNSKLDRANYDRDKNAFKMGGDNWLGFEKGWGQERYEKFDPNAVEGDTGTWSVYRTLDSPYTDEDIAAGGCRNPHDLDNAWYIDAWAGYYQSIAQIPETMLEWDQAAADEYTAQCKAARGL